MSDALALPVRAAPRRVLVLRFSSVGDVVLTSPAIEALATAWPDTEIVYAIREGFEGLVQPSPYVHRVLTIGRSEGVWSFSRRIRAAGFSPPGGPGDWALLDLHNSTRCRLLRPLLPRSRRSIWTKRPWGDGLTVRLGLKTWRGGIWLSDRFHRAVEALVGRPLPRGRLRHWLGPDDRDRARDALTAAGFDLDAPIVGFSPGAGWETKRWPIERFVALARDVLATGRQVVVSGSPDERPLCDAIVDGAPGARFVKAKLDVWGGIISLCDGFVANDSGPMHIARGLGVPTLALFGSTDPDQFDFRGHAVMFNHQPCAPCHFYGRPFCPRLHFRCLRDIGAGEAWGALEGLLDAGARPIVRG